MATYIDMPKLSDTMTEGTLAKWRKKEGDKVEAGDILAEVETDKATMEMEVFTDGVVHKLLVAEGSKVALGEKIAIILAEGEEPPADDAAPAPEKKAAPAKKPAKAEKAEPVKQEAPKAEPQKVEKAATGDRVKASPLAKKIAAAKGIDLSALAGSGPGGRIVAKDVESAKPGKATAAATGGPAPKISAGTTPAPEPGTERRIPLNGMRRTIAERLLQSKTQIPHFYLNLDIDAGPLLKLREQLKAAGEILGLNKVTVNDFVLRATAIAATRVPRINATFTEDAIVEFGSVNLSVAVALEDGLITPVIRDAQNKRIAELSAEMKDLATRARNKKLKPDEYQGGTISISNLGGFGVQSFAAIINPPQAAILSIGAIVKQPVVNERDEIVAGHVMNIGLSGDHRVADGVTAAQFLQEMKRLLENPSVLLA
jgi:pyruvate dehydrogenase E2 component (dihydrolipoamide acetyltransferase)